jgi:hypothetical protein
MSNRPHWTWFDHRLHPSAIAVPPALSEGRHAAKLMSWSVPIRLAGRAAAIQGHVEFRPVLGQVQARVTSASQPFEDVTVSALSGRTPELSIFATSTRPVAVLGREGEPFARVSSRGTEVNLRSETYAYDRRSRGLPFHPPPRAAGVPRWRRVMTGAVYSWRDPRLASATPPRRVQESPEPTVLTTWSVDLERRGSRRAVRGTTSWMPVAPRSTRDAGSTDGSLPWRALLFLTLGLVAAVVLVTRLRGRAATASR